MKIYALYMKIIYENTSEEVSVLVSFQERPAFSDINGKLSPRPFEGYSFKLVFLEK